MSIATLRGAVARSSPTAPGTRSFLRNWRTATLLPLVATLLCCGDSDAVGVWMDLPGGEPSPFGPRVLVVAGDDQEATVGTALDAPLVVQVLDENGRVVVGASVTWEFEAGGGRQPDAGSPMESRLVTRTDASGHASVVWELGPTAGIQSAVASLSAGSSPAGASGPVGVSSTTERVRFKGRGKSGVPASIVVTPATLILPVGQSTVATAQVKDSHGNTIQGLALQWTTSSAAVATVSSAGTVTARGTGMATISAVLDSLRGTASVQVVGAQYAEVATVVATPETVDFRAAGDTTSVSAWAENSVGERLTGITFEFRSSDPSVAEVNAMGRLTAKALGTALISVSALCCGVSDGVEVQVGGSTDTLTITVINQNSVVVSTLNMVVGDSALLDATAANALGLSLGNVDPTWSSSSSSVATVSSTGVVRALAAGSTNIVASYGGVTATVPTTVTAGGTQPPPPPPPQGSWPNNEPTGMTQILFTNGSDKYFGGSPTSPGWFYGGRWNDNTFVQAGIPDASSRYGSVIEKRMVVGDVAGWNGLAEYNWASSVGVKRHLYVRTIFKYSSNYQFCAANEKMFYVGGPGGDGADVYIGVIGSSGATYLANEFNGGGFNNIFFNYTITKGQYMTVEEYFVAESAPGSSDGEYYVWINGVLRASATGQNWSSGTPGFSQIDVMVYWGGASCTKTVNDVISISEIYVSGK